METLGLATVLRGTRASLFLVEEIDAHDPEHIIWLGATAYAGPKPHEIDFFTRSLPMDVLSHYRKLPATTFLEHDDIYGAGGHSRSASFSTCVM